MRKINLSNLFTGKSFFGQKSHWTIDSLDNSVIGQKSLGQLSPWTIVSWTIVATPFTQVCIWVRSTKKCGNHKNLIYNNSNSMYFFIYNNKGGPKYNFFLYGLAAKLIPLLWPM